MRLQQKILGREEKRSRKSTDATDSGIYVLRWAYKWCNNILPWFCLGLVKCRHWYKTDADLWFNRRGFGGSWWNWRMTQWKAHHGMALIAFGWRPIVFWCFVIRWCFCCFDLFYFASCTLLLTDFGEFELMNLSKKKNTCYHEPETWLLQN